MKLCPRVAALSAAVALAIPSFAFATNGMTLIGNGQKSRAMGGVGIAFAQDALGGASNPAGTVDVVRRQTARIDAGIDLFNPRANAALGGEDNRIRDESDAAWFLIPNMGGAMKFNKKLSIGFTATPVGGGGSRYDENFYNLVQFPNGGGPPDTDTLGVNLLAMTMNPTVAYNLSKNHAIGGSLLIGVAGFRAYGLGNFTTFTISQTGDSLTNQGNDWAYGAGARVGYRGKFFDKNVTFGAVYSSKVYMTEFEKYKELFAEQGNFDLPASWGVGLSLRASKNLTLAFDVTETLYSQVASISNPGPEISGPLFPVSKEVNGLGQDGGLGFGYDDQMIYKFGAAWKANDKWTFRAGWNYGESPVKEEREIAFAIVAPAVTQHHGTLGFTYKMSRMMEFSASYVHAFRFKQHGPTYVGETGEIEMEQDSLGVSLGINI